MSTDINCVCVTLKMFVCIPDVFAVFGQRTFCIITCGLYGFFGSALNCLSRESFILGFRETSAEGS